MKRLTIVLQTVCAALLLVSPVVAQDAPKVIKAPILNGRAINFPKPVYPEAAIAAGIGGVIGVIVVIDEDGNVVSAEAELNDLRERRDVDGTKLEPIPADASLRASAEEAARKARFPPALVNNLAVRETGKLVYNFARDAAPASAPPSPFPSLRHPQMQSGGILNGLAVALPKPDYPAAAKAVGAAGSVSVQIAADENGNVEVAQALSGHPLLRAASEAAALKAKLSPAVFDGKAVKFTGILTYNFVLPKVEDK